MPFKKNDPNINRNGPPLGPKKKTVWMLESLAERGVDYEKMLADAMKVLQKKLKKTATAQQIKVFLVQKEDARETIDRLIKLGSFIGNKPREELNVTGIKGLIIERFRKPDTSSGEGLSDSNPA